MKKYYFEQTSYYEIEAENEARAKELVEFSSPVDYSEMLLTDVEEQERDFNSIYEILDDYGINYAGYLQTPYKFSGNDIELEFWTDTAGQDVCIYLNNVEDENDFINKFYEYAENYNVDEEVSLYVPSSGKNGVPDVVTLVKDCQEVKDTLTEVSEKLLKFQREHINNLEKTISNAKNKSSQQINTKCNSKEIERG